MTTNWLKNATSVSKTDSAPEPGFARPSVPLSVYRELVKELKETQGQVAILEQQNQRLRQQIEEIIFLTQQFPQIVDTLDSVNPIEPKISSNPELTVTTKTLNSSLSQSINGSKKESLSFFKDQNSRLNVPLQNSVSPIKGDGTINGWILAVAIVLIVLTSCTGAFLIVKFGLSYSSR